MSVSIGSHKLTTAEVQVLDAVRHHLRDLGGDSWLSATTSPKGDGTEIPVTDVFPPRAAQSYAQRQIVDRLGRLGVLAACEIRLDHGMLKSVPFELLKKISVPA